MHTRSLEWNGTRGAFLRNENIRVWIQLSEDQLQLQNVPELNWNAAVSTLLHNNGQIWYLQERSRNRDPAVLIRLQGWCWCTQQVQSSVQSQ